MSSSSASGSSSSDRYYGYGPISAVCTAAVTALFSPTPVTSQSSPSGSSPACLEQYGYPSPPPSVESSPQLGTSGASTLTARGAKPARQWKASEGIDTPPRSPVISQGGAPDVPDLMDFVAYALYRTRLPTPIVHSALLLLTRLKKFYPSARGTSSSPHRLFLSALMLASKMSMDDTYSNRSWCIVGQQLFTLPEVNRMERELFGFLNCNCCISKEELDAWTAQWLAPGGIIGPEPAILPRSPRSFSSVSCAASSDTRESTGSEERKRRRSNPAPNEPSASAVADRQRAASVAANALLHYTSAGRPSPPSSNADSSVRRSWSQASSGRLSTRGIAPPAKATPLSPNSPPSSSSSHHYSRHPRSHFRQNTSGSVPWTRSSVWQQTSDSSMRSTLSSRSGESSDGDRLPASLCGSFASVGSSPSSVEEGPWTPEVGVGVGSTMAIESVQGEAGGKERKQVWVRTTSGRGEGDVEVEMVSGVRWLPVA